MSVHCASVCVCGETLGIRRAPAACGRRPVIDPYGGRKTEDRGGSWQSRGWGESERAKWAPGGRVGPAGDDDPGVDDAAVVVRRRVGLLRLPRATRFALIKCSWPWDEQRSFTLAPRPPHPTARARCATARGPFLRLEVETYHPARRVPHPSCLTPLTHSPRTEAL